MRSLFLPADRGGERKGRTGTSRIGHRSMGECKLSLSLRPRPASGPGNIVATVHDQWKWFGVSYFFSVDSVLIVTAFSSCVPRPATIVTVHCQTTCLSFTLHLCGPACKLAVETMDECTSVYLEHVDGTLGGLGIPSPRREIDGHRPLFALVFHNDFIATLLSDTFHRDILSMCVLGRTSVEVRF